MRGITNQGKTVIFATHYLEEADAYADRIVLMARGRVVADGSTASVKAMVGRRTVRATVPDAEVSIVSCLPGVSTAERRGSTVVLSCDDADDALKALLARYPGTREYRSERRRPSRCLRRADRGRGPTGRSVPMTNTVYLKTELRRSLRNRKFLLFSLGFPLLLFFMIAGPNRTAHLDGVAFPLYYMTGMAAWGSMTAVISIGARIAAERQLGWGRQMRLTPLSTARYFQAKVLGGYLMAVISILALTAAGAALGVQLSLTRWLLMAVLILVVLLPFAVLGVLMGHVLKVDTAGPAMGGVTTLLALVGGTWVLLALAAACCWPCSSWCPRTG